MKAEQADELVDRIASAWHAAFSPDERGGWRMGLAPIPYELGLATLDALHSQGRGCPNVRRFLEVAQEIANKDQERERTARPRKNCPLCGGTGWRPAEVAGNLDAVSRCPCSPNRVSKHAAKCTCRTCMPMGGGEGMVGMPKREGADPLQYLGPKGQRSLLPESSPTTRLAR